MKGEAKERRERRDSQDRRESGQRDRKNEWRRTSSSYGRRRRENDVVKEQAKEERGKEIYILYINMCRWKVRWISHTS